MGRKFAIAFAMTVALSCVCRTAAAVTLNINPIFQETPEWCWAATSEMVLKFYGFPDLNPYGNYQCAIVGAQGGPCWGDCAFCLSGGGSTQRVAAVLRQYAELARMYTGYTNDDFNPMSTGILSPGQIIDSIDDDAPIIAGITPTGIPFPPGSGFSEHAVLIIGYARDEDTFQVIIDDPYPYPGMAIPYLTTGGVRLQPGEYELPYKTFIVIFRYGNSITFE